MHNNLRIKKKARKRGLFFYCNTPLVFYSNNFKIRIKPSITIFRIYNSIGSNVGYDPSEPPGSPYGFGNGSVMAEMDEIPYEKAIELTGGYA